MKAIVTQEEYDGLSEPLQGEYTKGEDERYYAKIDPVDGWAFENVENLRSTMRSERERRESWEKKFQELERKIEGVDPSDLDKIQEYKDKIAEMKTWTPDEKVQERIKGIEDEYREKLTAEQTDKQEAVSKRDKKIHKLLVSNAAKDILVELECLDPSLHMHQIEVNVKLDEKDVPFIADEHGDPVTTKKAGGVGKMSLKEFCEGLKKAHPQNFKGSRASGGGSDPHGAGGSGKQDDALSKLPPQERLKALRRTGAKL